MRSLETLVRAFHVKFGFAVNCPLREDGATSALVEAMMDLERAHRHVSGLVGTDLRAARASLMIEELRETIEAMITMDETALADGLADLAYVVTGTAVSYGMPIGALVEEVHRSNMTKDPGQFKPVKGENFSEPDIWGVLRAEERR